MPTRPICCYRSGPIERDPSAAFQVKNHLDEEFRKMGIKIIGDSFELLKERKCPQEIYGPRLKKLRNLGRFGEYNKEEKLLKPSLRDVRRATFMVLKPLPEASGGTTSETAMAWSRGIPKFVIVGSHGEGLLDSESTFMIRYITDYYSLVFNSEKSVVDFVRDHLDVINRGREALRKLIIEIKTKNPFVNDWPKPLYDHRFEGKTLIILGRPGAGKGTQARMLQDLAGFKYLGSGHELRKLASKLPILAESLGRGNLAPDIITHYFLVHRILKLEDFEPLVIDGSPKKLEEAKGLLSLLELLKRKPIVIVLDIDEELSRQRIVLRRNCYNCETSFCREDLVQNPLCPYCGNTLEVRPENSEAAAVDKIMEWYKTDVVETTKLFESKGFVVHVNGNRDKEEVFRSILEILKK